MKKITIVRHGKSDWSYDVSDQNRPLKKRGINDANLVSISVKEDFKLLDIMLSSHANRAQSTAKIFFKNFVFPSEKLIINPQLYDFSGNQLVKVIKSLSNNLNNVMLFGHNHAFTWFVNTYGSEYIDNVPTAGLVSIDFNIENWQNLKPGKTTKIVFPRHLKD